MYSLKEMMKIQSIIKNNGNCKIFSCKDCILKNKCNSDGVTKDKELLELAIETIDEFLKESGIEENGKYYTLSFFNYSIRIIENTYHKKELNKNFPNLNEIWKSKKWASEFLKKQFPKILTELIKRNTIK